MTLSVHDMALASIVSDGSQSTASLPGCVMAMADTTTTTAIDSLDISEMQKLMESIISRNALNESILTNCLNALEIKIAMNDNEHKGEKRPLPQMPLSL